MEMDRSYVPGGWVLLRVTLCPLLTSEWQLALCREATESRVSNRGFMTVADFPRKPARANDCNPTCPKSSYVWFLALACLRISLGTRMSAWRPARTCRLLSLSTLIARNCPRTNTTSTPRKTYLPKLMKGNHPLPLAPIVLPSAASRSLIEQRDATRARRSHPPAPAARTRPRHRPALAPAGVPCAASPRSRA
jgi:hypothetical protein